ncbi:phage baseplate assembly protein V [Streptomyces cinnabarinus]|uniref:Phage baseplate assembly protein V n=1 Tax=Streptomyces cinnabarinus TaxID=67287 RepID=A0ABY7KAR2_9ACTN|nr:phage baseplate assembly protein V [Streptomyces cinnabarinus]WAZ20016.1 phage baseplate assembly protein V [Streptomyces cinnabarinus]
MTAPAPATKKWEGLYQGVVVSNVDTTQMGRLLVRVPEVLGDDPSIWASPLSPLAGTASGMYVVPVMGSGVWVQFLGGDPNRAVWVGFWRGGAGEVPPAAKSTPPGVPQIVLATPGQNSLVISDQSAPLGGITLQLRGPAGPFIKIDEKGIELSCGPGLASIKLMGTQVIVNGGALMVQ